jgi:hypothetical protein
VSSGKTACLSAFDRGGDVLQMDALQLVCCDSVIKTHLNRSIKLAIVEPLLLAISVSPLEENAPRWFDLCPATGRVMPDTKRTT